ncbi:MAG: HK97 family phage prohead protease [Phycisphaerales bacterium]
MLPEPKTSESKAEFLSIAVADAELRAGDEAQPKLIGYASKYGNWYPVWDFEERIVPGAFDEVLRSKDTDVVASMNHDVNFAFARQSAGTLRLRSNSVGLQYEADITDDDGRRVHAKVKNGTIQGSSFMFSDVDDTWEFKDGEPPRRTITRVGRLYELGPVVWPANTQATVKARAAEILAEARQKVRESASPTAVPIHAPKEKDQSATISPERQREIDYSYQEMGRLINHVNNKNQSPDV